jgi:polyhydroxyalkanoate synthesis regulator phasin
MNVQKAGSAKHGSGKRSGGATRPGLRVNEVRMTPERSEEVLSKLRDLLTGPQQKLAEARYGEMVDILEEQDLTQQQNFNVLSSQISELATGISKLKEAFGELQAFYDKANTRHDMQMTELRAHVERALAAHAEEMNGRLTALSESTLQTMNLALADTRRDIEQVSTNIEDHKVSTAKGLETLKTTSMTAIDQRLAQWRAEREDERVDDLKAVADSFVDIGQRLAALRLNSYTIS